MHIEDKDFNRLVHFVRSNYGIEIEKKRDLVASRLENPLRRRNFANFAQFVDCVINNNNQEDIDLMINSLTTNYTFFMRETEHFDYFRQHVLPILEKKTTNNSLAVWSAGCSTGQEAYTLSMIMKDYFQDKPGKWDTRVLATDISQKVLKTAQEGVYSASTLRDVSKEWKRDYFIYDKNRDIYTVKPTLKENVIYRTFNLMDPIKFKAKFDVIFCRNVMIYFDNETKNELIRRFYDATKQGGYLFIGHSETISHLDSNYKKIMPSGFVK